jgi:hypothetical protein
MPLSQRFERSLRAAYEADEETAPLPPAPFTVGGTWYCPGCGTSLDPNLVCSTCMRSVLPFIVELVELHPHEPHEATERLR